MPEWGCGAGSHRLTNPRRGWWSVATGESANPWIRSARTCEPTKWVTVDSFHRKLTRDQHEPAKQDSPWLHSVTHFVGSRDSSGVSTGSRTHPWQHSVTHFVGSRHWAGRVHGFADSPVATLRHPLRGFA